jgi:hypothetical protein
MLMGFVWIAMGFVWIAMGFVWIAMGFVRIAMAGAPFGRLAIAMLTPPIVLFLRPFGLRFTTKLHRKKH